MAEEQKGGGDAKPQKKDKQVGSLKPGDYTVHILIEQAKEIQVPEQSAVDVMVEAKVGNIKKFTPVQSSVTATSNVSFMNHIFVDLQKQSVAQLETTKISIKLMEKGVFKEAIFGLFEFDFSYVYNMEDRTMFHQWVALNNPASADFSAVAAFLKLSVSIHGADDKPIELGEDPNPENDKCMMPAAIKPQYKQLKLHIVKGEHLPRLDKKLVGKGTMDAYCVAMVGQKKLKTATHTTKDDAATWNQTMWVPVRIPIMAGQLVVKIMDEDTVKDECAGSLVFDFKNLLERESGSFFWCNLYGAPGGDEIIAAGGDTADQMNQNPNIATLWKGRILCGIEYEDSENPIAKVTKFEDPELRKKSEEKMQPVKWKFMFEIGSCIVIPEENTKYGVRIKIGEHEFDTEDKIVVGTNYNRFNQRPSKPLEWDMPYGGIENMADVFIYLTKKKGGASSLLSSATGGSSTQLVSYARMKASEFASSNPKIRWVELKGEPIADLVKSPELAGILSFKISIIDPRENPVDIMKEPEWAKKLPRRPKLRSIRAYIYSCKDLPAADEDGSSDPYIQVWDTADKKEQIKKTEVINDTCDPMYYQCLQLSIEGHNLDELPPFVFDCYDIDVNVLTSDDRDYMGRCLINVHDAAYIELDEEGSNDTGKPPEPKWHKFYYKQGGAPCGEILVSFVIAAEFDYSYKTDLEAIQMMGLDDQAIVRFEEFKIDINVLGLRGLVSPGLLPVKKAYIKFLLKSLVPPIAASNVETVETVPGPAGVDPTINTVVSFNMLLPVEELYAPSLACRVFDKIFKGYEGALIGTFSIPIGQIMFDQRAEFEQNMLDLDVIIDELEKIRDGVGVQSYDTNRPDVKNEVNDKKFKQEQQKQKAAQQKAVHKPSKSTGNKKSAVSDMLVAEKNKQMKKPLILHTDEDSDEDGNEVSNPVAKPPQTSASYQPPTINMGGINNDEETQAEDLTGTPRSQLSASQRRQVDAEAIEEVLSKEIKQQRTVSKDKNADDPNLFKPVASPRMSAKQFEDAIRKTESGKNTPTSEAVFDKVQAGVTKKVVYKITAEHMKQKRLQKADRDIAEAATEADIRFKTNICRPKYEMNTRLNNWEEVEKPPKEIFEPLGWDRKPHESEEKHYRKFFTEELEKVKTVMAKESEFQCYDLKKGQARGAPQGLLGGLFGGGPKLDESGAPTDERSVGKFKALITVSQKSEEQKKLQRKNWKLSKIIELIRDIHRKKYGIESGIKRGFFGEQGNLEEAMAATNRQSARPASQSANSLGFGDKVEEVKAAETAEMNVFSQEGRNFLRDEMLKMNLRHLKIGKKIADVQSDEIIKRLLVQDCKCLVRLFVISAYGLAQRDNDSDSDPFTVVKLGDKKTYNDRENYKDNEPNPDIYKQFNFEAVFPGCPELLVQLWDMDMLFGDELIGETRLDIEDRYFSADWRSIGDKPIEHRQLYHPSSAVSQGTVKLWAEIIPVSVDIRNFPTFDISPKPSDQYEIRVAVFETKELKMMDVEGTTDGFIKAFFNPKNAKETDTHYRNQNGNCSFNYRLLYKFDHPAKSNEDYKLKIQAYDRDFFKSNDLIGEYSLDLKPIIEDSEIAVRPMAVAKDYYDEYLKVEKELPDGSKVTYWPNDIEFHEDKQSFWVPMLAKDEKTGKLECNGKVRIQVDVYPIADAVLNKVGEAREEPNVNPYLPLPVGRLTLSLNPLKMLNQFVGPGFRKKLYTFLCIALCIAICIAILPMVMSDLISKAIMSMFGLD